jgi:hypothetical protein
VEGDGLMPIPVRTRLQNLKHLSVDKMASLKQMLVENRRGGGSSTSKKGASKQYLLYLLFNLYMHAAAEEPSNKEIVTVPEEMQGPEIYAPQYSKERYLLSTYNPSTQLLKVRDILDVPKCSCKIYFFSDLSCWYR